MSQTLHQAHHLKGVAFSAEGLYQDSIDAFDRALECDPTSAESALNKAISLHNLGRDDEANTATEKAIGIRPDFVEAWSYKGVALSTLEKYDAAIEAFNHSIELETANPHAYFDLGIAYFRIRQFPEAVTAFDHVLEQIPNFAHGFLLQRTHACRASTCIKRPFLHSP